MLPQIPHFFKFKNYWDKKDLPHLGLVSLLIFGIIIGVYLSLQPQLFKKQAQESSLVELKFIPDSLQIQEGRVYEAKIAVNPKTERLTAVQLYIGYDPAKVSIMEVKNEGFLPVTLKTEDSFDGSLNLVYGSTIETQAKQPGMLAVLKFKVLDGGEDTEISIQTSSQASVSSKEGNVLTSFPKLDLKKARSGQAPKSEQDLKYPDNLLLEKAFLPDSEPAVREFKEALEPELELKPERVKPSLSEAYIKQLGKDIFIDPIIALNQVLEEKAGEIINSGER